RHSLRLRLCRDADHSECRSRGFHLIASDLHLGVGRSFEALLSVWSAFLLRPVEPSRVRVQVFSDVLKPLFPRVPFCLISGRAMTNSFLSTECLRLCQVQGSIRQHCRGSNGRG